MKLLDAFLLLQIAALAPAQALETARVVDSKAERTAKLPGELVPYQQVEIRSRVTGIVETVLVDRGSIVREGDVLVRLSAPEMQSDIAAAEARVQSIEAQKAEANARRVSADATYSRLHKASQTPGTVAGNDLVQAKESVAAAAAVVTALEKAVAAAQAQVKSLKELADYLHVKAPFPGVVTARLVHPGALAAPQGGALLEIEQLNKLRLVVPVPETDLGAVRAGRRASFTVAAFPGRTFSGAIARKAGSLDPKTRTMPVELDVDNPSMTLAPGMYAEVDWPVVRAGAVLLVPATSVATTTEKVFVIRVRDGKAEYVSVRKGAKQGELVEVQGALSVGDVVLKRATDEIRDRSPVSVK